MEYLPWLVTHGALVWTLALGVFIILLGVPLVFGIAALQIRRRHRRRLAMLGAPVTKREQLTSGDIITIEGTLRASGRRVERIEDGSQAAVVTVDFMAAAGQRMSLAVRAHTLLLNLDFDGQEIELLGELAVDAGSRELRMGVMRRKAHEERLGNLASDRRMSLEHIRGPMVARSLAEGERVRARGRLRGEGLHEDASGHREQAVRWILEAAPVVHLAAVAPPRLSPTSWPRYILGGVVLGALCFFMMASYAGHTFMKRAWDEEQVLSETRIKDFHRMITEGDESARARHSFFPIPDVHPLVLAAATPFHRQSALAAISDRFDNAMTPMTPERFQAEIALADFQSQGCPDAIELRIRHRLYGPARDSMSSCASLDDPERLMLEAEMAVLQARFAEASERYQDDVRLHEKLDIAEQDARELVRSYRHVHLLARRWQSAADALRRSANFWRGFMVRQSSTEAWDAYRRDGQECLASAALMRAGRAEARASLDELRTERAPILCTLALADVMEGPERVALLEDVRRRLDQLPELTEEQSNRIRGMAALIGPSFANEDEIKSAQKPLFVMLHVLLLAEVDMDRVEPDMVEALWTHGEHDFDAEPLVSGWGGENPYWAVIGHERVDSFFGLEYAVLTQLMNAPESCDALPGSGCELRAYLSAKTAVATLVAERPDEARRWAAQAMLDMETAARTGVDDDHARKLGKVGLLQAVVALRTGDARAAQSMLEQLDERTAGYAAVADAVALHLGKQDIDGRLDAAWQAEQVRLVMELSTHGNWICGLPLELGFLAPHLGEHRARLAELVRWCPYDFSVNSVTRLGNLIWLSRALGDDTTARALAEIAGRHQDALRQREPAVLLALLSFSDILR